MRREVNDTQALTVMLDQNEVAALLKVSPKTMEYWRCRGGGPRFLKVGRLARYLESDIRDFMTELKRR